MSEWVTSIIRTGSTAFSPKKHCVLDNFVFKLHYKVTSFLLVSCVFLLTGSLWVGKPISCIVSHEMVTKDVFENHCLMTGAKTIYRTKSNPYKDNEPILPYPGIVPITNVEGTGYEEKYHPLYKFTAMILFLGAVLFYFPHWIWKIAEGGRLNALRQEMGWRSLLSAEDKDEQLNLAVKHLLDSRGRTNLFYFLAFFSLEFVNLLISSGVLYGLNFVFENQFVEHGFENVYLPFLKQQVPRYDSMDKLFPKVAKCDMEIFGPTGTRQRVDGLCFLYHNYLNEIIFVLLWFWLAGVTILTALYLILFRSSYFIPRFRATFLHNMCPANCQKDIRSIATQLWFSDWFLLMALLAEIPPVIAYSVIKELASELRKKNRTIRDEV